jgi:hypothetical protein
MLSKGTKRTTVARAAQFIGGAGVLSIGAIHLAWGAGVSWPAQSREQLSDIVTGSTDFPSAGACAVVAAPLLAAGAMALTNIAGAHPKTKAAALARLVESCAATGLLARAVVGGKAAATAVGLPAPSTTFLDWDQNVYRPLCAVLGGSLLAGRLLAREAS